MQLAIYRQLAWVRGEVVLVKPQGGAESRSPLEGAPYQSAADRQPGDTARGARGGGARRARSCRGLAARRSTLHTALSVPASGPAGRRDKVETSLNNK